MSRPLRLPILALSPSPWTQIWMNRQQLLSRLGRRGWQVVYSTGTLTTWDRRGPRWDLASWTDRRIETDDVTIVRAGRIHAYWPRLKPWEQFEERRFANRLLATASTPSETRRCILFLSHPQFAHVVDLVNPAVLIYHAYDTYARMPDWTPDLASRERELVQRASLIIASSRGVVEHLPDDGPRRAHVVLNGVDAAAFRAGADTPAPAELATIRSPRLGYVGRMSDKVDFGLIATLAAARPEWNWVLVGPVTAERYGDQLAACRAMPNVHFLGERAYWQLPGYTAHMDVNVMPYRQSEGWWHGSYPLKLHEYFAAGRPVVLADVGIDLPDPGLVTLATTAAEWEAALAHAVAAASGFDPGPQRRLAEVHTWEHRVNQLEALLLGCIPSI